jgi:hypothetical protein
MESASLGDLGSALIRSGDEARALESYAASLAIEVALYGEAGAYTRPLFSST